MLRAVIGALILALGWGPIAANARAQDEAEDLGARVRQAIERGIGYLRQRQLRGGPRDGAWPDIAMFDGGVTTLCTLAMLNAGVSPDDPDMKRALKYLRGVRPEKTYVVALQTMVFCAATPEQDKLLIRRNANWLVENQLEDGSWAYPQGSGDNSNSQFALLALHEAERAGVTVPASTWRSALTYWKSVQAPRGYWGYPKQGSARGSMTCAGIASVVIASAEVYPTDAEVNGERIECCHRNPAADDSSLRRAISWLANNFTVKSNPGYAGWALYYLYGLERVGRLTARRFIGEFDWYREGCKHLVSTQDQLSGFWQGTGMAENEPLIATPLALLFLSKGRRPVVMAKLHHGPEESWNHHRSDVNNLTRYVETLWKRDLTWEVVDLDAATVDDLVKLPVLYLAGRESPLPGDPAAADRLARKLRDYIDRGGFIFAEGNCDRAEFDAGFRGLVDRIFPEPEYKLRVLEPQHPVYRAEQVVDPDLMRPLMGVEFGCRTSIVYVPPATSDDTLDQPLSCLWELGNQRRMSTYSESVRRKVQAGLAIGANVVAYATGREVVSKEAFFTNEEDGQSGPTIERGQLTIASLRHPGGCDAAPRALTHLLEFTGKELNQPVSAEKREIGITSPQLFQYFMVFMHGRHAFRLTDKEREALRVYVERGGILFADSICASEPFTRSFRAEMKAIFPDRPLEPIPPDHPMFTPIYGGDDIRTVTRRDPQPAAGDGPMTVAERKVPPALEGIQIEDRYGVIFSPYDLSCALEKYKSLECRGYTREDAERIGLNVIRYGLHN